MSGTARLGLAQFEPAPDTATTLTKVAAMVRAASSASVGLLVLPEASMATLPSGVPWRTVAEPLSGPFVTALAELARTERMSIVAGVFEPADETRVYNTVVTVGPDGALVGGYRKLHLYDAFGERESDDVMPGNGTLLTFDRNGLRFGVMTCYDVRFPELARALVDQGADVLLVPAAWVRGSLKEEHWEVMLRARAIENTTWVAGAGKISRLHIGCSMLVDPMGVPVQRLGGEEGLLVGEVSSDAIAHARDLMPVLAGRRFTVVPRRAPGNEPATARDDSGAARPAEAGEAP